MPKENLEYVNGHIRGGRHKIEYQGLRSWISVSTIFPPTHFAIVK